jgi:hypothetical protein
MDKRMHLIHCIPSAKSKVLKMSDSMRVKARRKLSSREAASTIANDCSQSNSRRTAHRLSGPLAPPPEAGFVFFRAK